MILLALAIIAGQPAPCPSPTHYDGDAIRCASVEWRALSKGKGLSLHAIDAPEIDCAGRPWRCSTQGGIASRDHLRALTLGQDAVCTWTGEWTHGRPVVDCRVRSTDLACAQLRTHHARYWPRYDPDGGFLRRCP